MPQREPTSSRWTPQSTTALDDPSPWVRARLARGSAPPPAVDDGDTTAPRVRMIALFEPEPAVPVSLERPRRARTEREELVVPVPARRRAPSAMVILVVVLIALLGWLMLMA